MFVALFLPVISTSAAADSTIDADNEAYDAQGVIIGDLANFDVSDGREYLLFDEETPIVSAYGFMKQAWIDAGMPGVEDMMYEPVTHGRASGRACNPHLVGDSLTVPISGGSLMHM